MRRFLDEIEANLPRGFEVHLVMDNYGTRKVAKVRRWLTRVAEGVRIPRLKRIKPVLLNCFLYQ